jgi:hypothetical protein
MSAPEQDDYVDSPSDGWRMACDVCRQDFDMDSTLFAPVRGGASVCVLCWRRMGRPFPPPGTMAEVQAAEAAMRDRMQARNSADRHMVRSGKT